MRLPRQDGIWRFVSTNRDFQIFRRYIRYDTPFLVNILSTHHEDFLDHVYGGWMNSKAHARNYLQQLRESGAVEPEEFTQLVRYLFSGVPEPYWNASTDDWSCDSKIQEQLQTFQQNFNTLVESGGCFLFTSDYEESAKRFVFGCLKTYLDGLSETKPTKVNAFQCNEYFQELKDFENSSKKLRDSIEKCRVAYMYHFGKEYLAPGSTFVPTHIEQLFRLCITDKKLLIISSHLTVSALQKHYECFRKDLPFYTFTLKESKPYVEVVNQAWLEIQKGMKK